MLISYLELLDLIDKGVIRNVDRNNVNGSSIDIRLGKTILVEEVPDIVCPKCGQTHKNTTDGYLAYISLENRNRYFVCRNIGCSHSGRFSNFIKPVDFSKKEPLNMKEVNCENKPFILWPGQAILAHSVEIFYLPDNITAEYRLKSSMARVFLEHLHAGWCDPMWQGSVLTLEFKNESLYHPLQLTANMKCGQVCFYKHEPVPVDKSYAVRGQYNNDIKATPSKGIK